MAYDDAILRQQRAELSTSSQEKINASNVYDDAILRRARAETLGTERQETPLRFPIENQDRFKGNMSFQAYKVIPPDIKMSSKLLSQIGDRVAQGLKTVANPIESIRQSEVSEQSYVGQSAEEAGLISQQAATTTSSPNVEVRPMQILPISNANTTLYIPTSFVVNDIISYETPSFGIAGAAGLQALQNTGDIVGAAGKAVTAGVSGLKDMFGSSLNGVAARVAAARAASFIPSNVAQDVIRSAAQVTVNPNVRAMFRGVAIREFTFQFKFIPKSREESEQLKKIIRFFRYHAYPEGFDVKGVPVAFIFPSMFKIKLNYNNSPIGSRIKLSYLRTISTNYNPTSSSFHADGSPSEIDLSLTFLEHKTLTRQDIEGNRNGSFIDDGDGF